MVLTTKTYDLNLKSVSKITIKGDNQNVKTRSPDKTGFGLVVQGLIHI